MKKLQLFRELRRHRKLAEARMVDFEKNRVAKVMSYIMAGVAVIYLLMFAIMISLGGQDLRTMTAVGFLTCFLPFIVAIDFSIRFIAQQTPSQIVKPYLLLPLNRYTCTDFFLFGQMLNWSNLIWFVMIVPFCFMSVIFSYGLWVTIGLLFFFWVLELCISQFYLITRTLVTDTMKWWVLPFGVAVVACLPALDWADIPSTLNLQPSTFFDRFFNFYSLVGEGIVAGSLWPYIAVLLLLAVLLFINRRLQYSHVMEEVQRVEKVQVVSQDSRLSALSSRLSAKGTTGLFLGLELRTVFRNKNPRKSFITGISVIIMFSFIIIFTDVYDSPYMGNFWCMYNYTIFGAMSLVKIMGSEGNYIDGLMVRRENILHILRAKYYFNCMVLLLPFLLMLPTVFSGKWSLLMVFSYGIFNAGFNYFLFFQLAVINKQTIPLNTKFISRNGMENNYWQVLVQMVCMLVPYFTVMMLQTLFSPLAAYLTMLLLGTAFILTHKLWLRNIYNRFMKRRYQNMEGFRQSR